MPARQVALHLLRHLFRLATQLLAQIVDRREAEAVAIERSAPTFTAHRVDLRPIAYLKHAPEAEPLVANAGVNRLAAQRNVCDGLEVAADEADASVRHVEAPVVALGGV